MKIIIIIIVILEKKYKRVIERMLQLYNFPIKQNQGTVFSCLIVSNVKKRLVVTQKRRTPKRACREKK